MPSAFNLQNITVAFGELKALDAVSLNIDRGEQVAIVGPSGGGKTTLLRALNGMAAPCGGQAAPCGGQAAALGRDLASLPSRQLRALRSQIGFIPQNLGLVPGYRVLQNVMLGRAGRRSLLGSLRDIILPAASEVEKVHALLGEAGISEKLYERASSLSGGQQQRTAIARALYQNAVAILADEPVSNVDPARARSLIELLLKVSRDHGLTLVMSLHHVELAREFFPRVIGLRHGSIAFDARPAEVSAEKWAALFQLTAQEVVE